jgi:two-component system sensor histidine kinase ChvG
MSAAAKIDTTAPPPSRDADVVLGEDWIAPEGTIDRALREKQVGNRLIAINRSPLARKIITFNLLGLVVLVAGVLYLNPFRDSLSFQARQSLLLQANLASDVLAARLTAAPEGVQAALQGPIPSLHLAAGSAAYLFDPQGELLSQEASHATTDLTEPAGGSGSTVITGFLNTLWDWLAGAFSVGTGPVAPVDHALLVRALVPDALAAGTQIMTAHENGGGSVLIAAAPVVVDGNPVAVIGLSGAAGAIDDLVRREREQVLQMFIIAILVSIGLSLVLASTIANPLADLAAAAEIGRDRNARKVSPGRIRIPDLTGRPDEIGRLSGALRGMVSALYDRIDANEQFAADVAHEIKNPLASLRSAVGTLRVAKRDDQRAKLLDVIEHDVRRLDRLVSDISNASRLDSELVKEEEEPFNLLKMLGNLADYLGKEARGRGVDFITDLPPEPIIIHGLEARLAQVFVNLITNALSFCEEGDAVRIWARRRENRVLVVVEDTGPGIPEQALQKIFKRFYSDRPAHHFGNNSGLGLAISKQIVEAHGGVIWAENIRPTEADITSDPLGARFVVGLPV